jgi:hypothetical protein
MPVDEDGRFDCHADRRGTSAACCLQWLEDIFEVPISTLKASGSLPQTKFGAVDTYGAKQEFKSNGPTGFLRPLVAASHQEDDQQDRCGYAEKPRSDVANRTVFGLRQP